MKKPQWFDPHRIFVALDEIDQQTPSYTLNRHDSLRRIFWTLACVCVSLLLIHYLKFFSSLQSLLEMLSHWQQRPTDYWLQKLQYSGYVQLFGYAWWTFWHVIGYIVLPFLVIRYKLNLRMRDLGWRFSDTLRHWRGYVLLLTPILVCVSLVSFREDFVHHYPFYKPAGRSWFDLLSWEFLYLTQFVCLEFFFRGFIINSLRPAIGANAVWVMCVPYLMIHFPKLWLEASGAILFGLFLGILALRSRSIWGGFGVHAGVAVSMDVASLLQQGTIPSQFWPQ